LVITFQMCSRNGGAHDDDPRLLSSIVVPGGDDVTGYGGAVGERHHDVEQDEVERSGVELPDGVRAVLGAGDLISTTLEEARDQDPDRFVVIDHQDACTHDLPSTSAKTLPDSAARGEGSPTACGAIYGSMRVAMAWASSTGSTGFCTYF
jgi:hypothetical protein